MVAGCQKKTCVVAFLRFIYNFLKIFFGFITGQFFSSNIITAKQKVSLCSLYFHLKFNTRQQDNCWNFIKIRTKKENEKKIWLSSKYLAKGCMGLSSASAHLALCLCTCPSLHCPSGLAASSLPGQQIVAVRDSTDRSLSPLRSACGQVKEKPVDMKDQSCCFSRIFFPFGLHFLFLFVIYCIFFYRWRASGSEHRLLGWQMVCRGRALCQKIYGWLAKC